MPTVPQIKAKLDELGVSYPSNALKPELEELLAANQPSDEPTADPSAEEPAEASVDQPAEDQPAEPAEATTDKPVEDTPPAKKGSTKKSKVAEENEEKTLAELDEAKGIVRDGSLGKLAGKKILRFRKTDINDVEYNELLLEDGSVQILSDRDLEVQRQGV